MTGIAGAVLATMTGYVSPESFSFALGTNLIAAAVLGGVGSILGAAIGGSFLTYAATLAELIGVSLPILQGAVLIAVLLLLPRGVVGSLARLLRAAGRKIRPPAHAAFPPAHAASLNCLRS